MGQKFYKIINKQKRERCLTNLRGSNPVYVSYDGAFDQSNKIPTREFPSSLACLAIRTLDHFSCHSFT